jgi:hypothetical protein
MEAMKKGDIVEVDVDTGEWIKAEVEFRIIDHTKMDAIIKREEEDKKGLRKAALKLTKDSEDEEDE